MQRIFYTVILLISFLFTFALTALADEVYKITGANFDTSNSVIVLSVKDTDIPAPLENIKLTQLEGRSYFDINSSVITFPKKDWIFNSGSVKEIKISQFSNDNCKVRVVIYHDENFNPNDIKFYRIKNNIIIKLKNSPVCNNPYFQNTCRDEHSSSNDFYEYMTVTSPIPQDNITGQINNAFNIQQEQIFEKKELKLNTKYYLNNISTKQNGILINGFGSVTIERPMILQNPSRIVYDLPNTLVDTKLRNRIIKINETESVKIGQFSVNKARIVINTEATGDYIPIYSSNNQSLIFANYKKTNNQTLYNKVSNIISYSKEKENSLTESMILQFDEPLVHGIDRYNNKLIVYMYNTLKYSESAFKETYKNTFFEDATIDLMPKVGLKLTIPLENDAMVSTYLGADGKSFKIKIKEAKKRQIVPDSTIPAIISNQQKDKQTVVLDAGHGGSDTGAIGANIYEKDITLDITKRVEKILKEKGYDVKMTRTDDSYVSLQDRVTFSESYSPDIFVSVHVNSSVKPEITGIETHYYHQESMSLAQTVHASLASTIHSNDRGLFKSKFYVINHTTSPAILIEIGFISNEEERNQMLSETRKQQTAQSIADGIQKYLQQYK